MTNIGNLGKIILLLIIPVLIHVLSGIYIHLNRCTYKSTKLPYRYLYKLMPLLVKMAKICGGISQRQFNEINHILVDLNISDSTYNEVRKFFFDNLVMINSRSYEGFVSEARYFARRGYSADVYVITYTFIIRVATADHVITPAICNVLIQAAEIFKISFNTADQIFNSITGLSFSYNFDRNFNNTYNRREVHHNSSRASDLALFGLSSNATDEEIKKVYRKKVKELHPDRLQPEGVSARKIKCATEQLAEINAAYGRLIK